MGASFGLKCRVVGSWVDGPSSHPTISLLTRVESPPLSREDQVDLRTASLCSAETGHIYIVGRPLLSDDLGTVQDEVITSITPPPPHPSLRTGKLTGMGSRRMREEYCDYLLLMDERINEDELWCQWLMNGRINEDEL